MNIRSFICIAALAVFVFGATDVQAKKKSKKSKIEKTLDSGKDALKKSEKKVKDFKEEVNEIKEKVDEGKETLNKGKEKN